MFYDMENIHWNRKTFKNTGTLLNNRKHYKEFKNLLVSIKAFYVDYIINNNNYKSINL